MQAIGLDFLSGHRGMVRIADTEPPLSGDPSQGGVLVTSLWAYPAGRAGGCDDDQWASLPISPLDGRLTREKGRDSRAATQGPKEETRPPRLRAPFSSARFAPRPDGPLTHFASPRGETGRL